MNKITLNTLPNIFHIFRALFSISNIDYSKISKPWLIREKDVPFWFSRSSIAMLVIIKWYEAFTGKAKPVLWVPDYFCNEPIKFLKNLGYSFTYYPVHNSLTPDWESCESMAAEQKPDIFFLVHYFGKCNEVDIARDFCDNLQCILVEDAAHVMIPYRNVGKYGDFTFYSQHKLFAIPDGSLLVQKKKSNVIKQLSTRDPVAVLEDVYNSLPKSSPKVCKWLIKRTLQKFLPDKLWLNKKNNNESKSLDIVFKPFQSVLGKRLLSSQISRITDYVLKRKINNIAIKIGYDNYDEKIDCDYIPYMTMIDFCNEKNAEIFYSSKGSPFMKWPDLPDEIESISDHNLNPKYFKNTHLFAPIHQSININAVKRMKKLLNTKEITNSSIYSLSWPDINEKEWDYYISESDISNYLQSWEYGNAKKTVERWTIKRAVIKKNDEVIAFFQMLLKKIGPISLCRINRGPIFIKKLSLKNKFNVLHLIKREFNWVKGKILMIERQILKLI